MRYHLKRTLSTTLAVALLGCAVMLSVSAAKGPYRHAAENAFDGPPPGHLDKALISAAWIDQCDSQSFVTDEEAFDWGLEPRADCPKCGFKDSQVTPVVLDMPELLGGSDETAIDVIKRKLGINAFRGSIFDGPEAPTAQLLKHNAPAELKTFDCVLEKLTAGDAKSTCGAECVGSQAGVCNAEPSGCADTCIADCKMGGVAVGTAASDCTLKPMATVGDDSDYGADLSLVHALPSRVEQLRLHSNELDEFANKLEASDLYAEADALRETAQRLRLKARELKTGALAKDPPPKYHPVSITNTGCDCCSSQCGSECKCSDAALSGEQPASATGLLKAR